MEPDLVACLRMRRAPFAWLVMGVSALAIGALFAAVLAISRTPGLAPLLGAHGAFPAALVMHVTLVTLVWMLSLMSACWLALADPVPRWARTLLTVAAAGVLMMLVAWWRGSAAVLSNYLPILVDPWYVAGLSGFFLAVVLIAMNALVRLDADAIWVRGLRLTALQPLLVLAALALTWAGLGPERDRGLAYLAEPLFWPAGHALQFAYVLFMMSAWLWLMRGHALGHAVVRLSLAMAALPALGVPVVLVLHAGHSEAAREAMTWLMKWGAWPGAVLLIMVLLSAIARAGRRQLGASEAVTLASIGLFVAGLLIGTLIRGNTTLVPAHYHGTIGAATLAGMAIVLATLRAPQARSNRRRDIGPAILPLAFGGGFVLLVAGLAMAGLQGAPRKLPLTALTHGQEAGVIGGAGLLLMAAGAVLAIVAVLVLAGTMLRGAIGQRGHHAPTLRGAIDRRWLGLSATLGLVMLGGLMLSRDEPSGPASGATPGHTPAGITNAAHASAKRAELASRFQQGVVMLHAREHAHALTAFHRVLQIDPQLPEAHVNLGFALLGLGRAAQARSFFESAIELRREQMNAYYGLAVALEATADLPGAIGAMRAYTHLARDDDPYLPKARSALWEWEQRLPRVRR